MPGRTLRHIEPFISSMQKLADQNLCGDDCPAAWIEALFSTGQHPSIGKPGRRRLEAVGRTASSRSA